MADAHTIAIVLVVAVEVFEGCQSNSDSFFSSNVYFHYFLNPKSDDTRFRARLLYNMHVCVRKPRDSIMETNRGWTV